MVGFDDILKGIFLFALALVILDFFLTDTLGDFSLLELFYDILYLIGCLWEWKDIALQELTYGDIITPLTLLIRIFAVFMVTMFDSGIDLFFDLITFFPRLIQDIFTEAGESLTIPICNTNVLYISFDIATFTFRAGLHLEVFQVIDAEILFQTTMLGTDSFTKGEMVFPELGLVGIHVSGSGSILIGFDFPVLSHSLEDEVKSALDRFFEQYSTPQDLYEYLVDYLK